MRQSGTLLLLSDPPRATFINVCERESGRAEEISIPSGLGHPLQVSLFSFNLGKEYGIWNIHFQTGSWGRSKVHEWKFCENLLASVMALHLHVAPALQYELFSAVLYSALCTFLKFLVSIRIYLERQRYGTATISEAEWIHWDSELSTAAQLATRLCTPRRLGPI